MKEDLKNFLRLSKELTRIRKKITEIQEIVNKPRASDLSVAPTQPKKRGKPEDFTNILAKLIDLQNFYNQRQEFVISEQLRIEKIIAMLSDPIERTIISSKYIDGMSWDDVAEAVSYERSHVFRLHNSAINKIVKFL